MQSVLRRRRAPLLGLALLCVVVLAAAILWDEPFTVAVVYTGLLTLLVAVISLIKPLRFLRVRSRRAAGVVLVCGLAIVVIGALLPTHLHQVARSAVALDEVMPAYQFSEFHSTRVHATPEETFAAIKAVTPGEIRLMRTLMAVMSLGQADLSEQVPMLTAMNDSGYPTLVERPNRELVLGGVFAGSGPPPDIPGAAEFRAADDPGYVKVAFNFVVRDVGGGWCTVTTETRVFATDPGSRRTFAAYWRVIYPGSWLLRVTWLAAIKERAERAAGRN